MQNLGGCGSELEWSQGLRLEVDQFMCAGLFPIKTSCNTPVAPGYFCTSNVATSGIEKSTQSLKI